MPWLRRLVTGLSPSRHVFDPGPIHVKFGVGILALRHASLRVIRFSPVSLIAFLSGQESEPGHLQTTQCSSGNWEHWKQKCILFWKEGLCSRMLSSGSGLCCRLPLFPGVKKRISISAVSYATALNTVVEIVSLFVFYNISFKWAIPNYAVTFHRIWKKIGF